MPAKVAFIRHGRTGHDVFIDLGNDTRLIAFSVNRSGFCNRAAGGIVWWRQGVVFGKCGAHIDAVDQQLAGFQVPEARTLIVKPHDRGALAAIEKAIRESDLGLQPSNDGIIIRLSIPVLTEQRRKEYVKIVKAKAEDGRVAIRNIRRKGNSDIEALKDTSEDEVSRAEKEIDNLTKQHIDAIDEALKKKEAELLEV